MYFQKVPLRIFCDGLSHKSARLNIDRILKSWPIMSWLNQSQTEQKFSAIYTLSVTYKQQLFGQKDLLCEAIRDSQLLIYYFLTICLRINILHSRNAHWMHMMWLAVWSCGRASCGEVKTGIPEQLLNSTSNRDLVNRLCSSSERSVLYNRPPQSQGHSNKLTCCETWNLSKLRFSTVKTVLNSLKLKTFMFLEVCILDQILIVWESNGRGNEHGWQSVQMIAE